MPLPYEREVREILHGLSPEEAEATLTEVMRSDEYRRKDPACLARVDTAFMILHPGAQEC